jgi:hypothetical protein
MINDRTALTISDGSTTYGLGPVVLSGFAFPINKVFVSDSVIVRLTKSVIAHNAVGPETVGSGAILTPATNTLESNATNGAVTGNYTSK